MMDLDYISFNINLNDGARTIKKREIFKVVSISNKLFASDLDNNLIFDIEPKNIDYDIKEIIGNLNSNYAFFSNINKQSNDAVIEIHPIFDIRKIDNLYLFSNSELNPSINVMKSGDKTAVVLLNNIYNTQEKIFNIQTKQVNKYYKISQKQDFDRENENKALFYYEIDGNAKTIRKLNEFQKILAYGNIKLTDIKSYLSDLDRLELNRIKADVQNYLNLWNKYNEIELKREFELFKKIGHIKYDYIDYGDEIKLYFAKDNFEKIKKNFNDKMIMIGNHEFLKLFNIKKMEDYTKIEQSLLQNKVATVAWISKDSNGKEIINDTERYIVVRTNDREYFIKHKGVGYIGLSLLGNQIAYKRREKAKEKIITGKTGIAKLYTLFTDNPEPYNKAKYFEIDNRLIKNPRLTENQREAISIICNTPDIAIIQGPPGTGKTTTILEALTQLNSSEDNKYGFGNNLLSGFRHETVSNMTDHMDLFGLPAIKIGTKSNDEENEGIEPNIIKFVDNLIDELLEKYKDLSVSDEEYVEFKKKYYSYVSFNNSIDASINILNDVKELERFKYDLSVSDKIESIICKLKKNSNKQTTEESLFTKFLYSLPLSKKAYDDDKERIELELDIYSEFKSLKDDVNELKKVFKEYNVDNVRNARRKLILSHRKTPSILATKQDKREIVEFLSSLFELIRCERFKKFDGDKVAILDYIDSLTENPKLIRDTLLDYEKVLGATNQQSLSKNMHNVKQDELTFDNVIIDEAATSSPLDLFIPMSLGKKRIVLVGDHRQLPNITDDDIIDKVSLCLEINSEEELQKIAKEMKTTLFEILMKKAKMLEAKDGIKRVITLNSQFRMHPDLGNIVSRNFYDKDGGIKSPRPATDFAHNYHNLTNKYLYWLNVEYDKKEKYRKGTSRINNHEAEKIAEHIKEALDSTDYENQSIGIITIYREQVKQIKYALHKIGIFDNLYNIMAKYSNQEIYIGTVDAFQGREFDIVYLSLAYTVEDISKVEPNKRYSRLAWENSDSLLCVAMSRQRKMLIVVGDHKLYLNDYCKKLVPSVYELALICGEDDMNE